MWCVAILFSPSTSASRQQDISAFAAGRRDGTVPTKIGFKREREKKHLQVPGRSLASESDFIIKGIKNIFLRCLTLCSAVISGFSSRLPRQTGLLHNTRCQPG